MAATSDNDGLPPYRRAGSHAAQAVQELLVSNEAKVIGVLLANLREDVAEVKEGIRVLARYTFPFTLY